MVGTGDGVGLGVGFEVGFGFSVGVGSAVGSSVGVDSGEVTSCLAVGNIIGDIRVVEVVGAGVACTFVVCEFSGGVRFMFPDGRPASLKLMETDTMNMYMIKAEVLIIAYALLFLFF